MSQDIVDKFSTHLKDVLTRALCFVVETNGKTIQPEHLLWALGTQKGCIGAEILKKGGLKKTDFKQLLNTKKKTTQKSIIEELNLQLSDEARRIVEKAVLTANVYGHRYVGTEHLLSGILQAKTAKTESFFSHLQIDTKTLQNQLSIVLKSTSTFPDITNPGSKPSSSSKNSVVTNSPGQEDKTSSALEYFSVELTDPDIQKTIDPVIGRSSEIERVMEILCRRTKNNPLLLGEPGVGKTAIVEGLAKKIVLGDVPPVLAHKRIFAIDMALLIAGTMYRGEFEARLRQVVDEVKENPDILLFIDEMHTIVGTGAASGSMDAANILKPALARGDIRCIGATTPAEHKKHIEADPALERRFQSVLVNEPSVEKAIEILEGVAPYYEQFHHVRISHEAIEQAVHLSQRYIQHKQLPDKAIDLIDEAAAAIRVADTQPGPIQKQRSLYQELETIKEEKRKAVMEERFGEAMVLKEKEERLQAHIEAFSQEQKDVSPVSVITEKEIARVLSRTINIPLEDLLSSNREKLLMLESMLRKDIFGQDHVVDIVAGALRRAKTGIAHPSRPLASFLFLGPSGVGKTQLAKSVAQMLFHSNEQFIRLDMSEYAEGFTSSKLIGAPAGYVGYKEGMNLTDRVRQRPYSVILFDEIEKAHKDVQNLLLQILEEGELTDSTGRKVNFKNTIVILTSNVGLERFERGGMGFFSDTSDHLSSLHNDVQTELRERFRPELLNRIDHTCLFHPLNQDTLEQIIRKQLDELILRLREQGLHITMANTLVPHIQSSIDSLHGARTIRNIIQQHIEHKIAQRMSKKDSPTKLSIKLRGKNIVVTRQR